MFSMTLARCASSDLLRAFDVHGYDTAQLREFYMQLTRIEDAFKNLKGDLLGARAENQGLTTAFFSNPRIRAS